MSLTPSGRANAIAFARSILFTSGRRGVAALLLVGASAAIEGVGLAVLAPLIGLIVAPEQLNHWLPSFVVHLLGDTREQRLAVLVAAFVAVMIVRALILRWRDVTLFDVQSDYALATRRRMVVALARAPWAGVAGIDHARITSLLTQDVARLAGAAHFLSQSAVAAALIAIQLGIAVLLAPVYAICALIGLAALAVVANFASGSSSEMGIGLVKAHREMLGSARNFLNGLKASAAQGASGGFAQGFDQAQQRTAKQQRAFSRAQANARAGYGIGTAIAAAGLIVGGVLAQVEPAVLVVLALIFARIAPLVLVLQQSAQQLLNLGPSYAAVESTLAELGDHPRPNDGDGQGVAPVAGDGLGGGVIALNGVGYHHPGGAGIADVTVSIAPGAVVGIHGPSGGGKTTLIDLVSGLLTPQAGVITLGGQPLPQGGWGGRIGYVPQDAFLFPDTVRQNLTWGDDGFSDADLYAALALVGAQARVAQMPLGLDTDIGERGGLLSGGERQRIGMARAILRRPQLLILDEATAALDPPAEQAILDRLMALTPPPTILLVAHRAESLSRCTSLIRVEHGRVHAD